MSIVRPFSAIHYQTPAGRPDISTRIAPPYDVLDQRDKDALLARDPLNFVKIDLPHVPPKAAGPAEAYQNADATLRQWLADGTMVRDDQPMLYVYHQRYQHEGRQFVRQKFFARLRLEPFGSGSVFPHERTFGGPKEDRLALTKATEANLSPIFGLYEDAGNEISTLLAEGLPESPLATGTLDDVESVLWGVSDQARIDAVTRLMQPKPIYIADGHHRYGTALLYRDWLTEQQGPLPDDHPANFVLCVFCAMEDPGLLILPTHRVLSGVRVPEDLIAGDDQLDVATIDATGPTAAIAALAKLGPQAVCWFDGPSRTYRSVRPRQADLLDPLEPDHSPAWRRLGLAFLHAYLIERLIKPRVLNNQDPTVQYVKAGPAAVELARESNGTAFLMQPTTMEEMRGVCGAGDLMPQKSTYFYPKLASGLVINPLA